MRPTSTILGAIIYSIETLTSSVKWSFSVLKLNDWTIILLTNMDKIEVFRKTKHVILELFSIFSLPKVHATAYKIHGRVRLEEKLLIQSVIYRVLHWHLFSSIRWLLQRLFIIFFFSLMLEQNLASELE